MWLPVLPLELVSVPGMGQWLRTTLQCGRDERKQLYCLLQLLLVHCATQSAWLQVFLIGSSIYTVCSSCSPQWFYNVLLICMHYYTFTPDFLVHCAPGLLVHCLLSSYKSIRVLVITLFLHVLSVVFGSSSMRCSGSRCMIRCNAEASSSCLAGRRPQSVSSVGLWHCWVWRWPGLLLELELYSVVVSWSGERERTIQRFCKHTWHYMLVDILSTF